MNLLEPFKIVVDALESVPLFYTGLLMIAGFGTLGFIATLLKGGD